MYLAPYASGTFNPATPEHWVNLKVFELKSQQ